nr:reverse transcriptase [Tanacetum cinerariifolium]
MLKICEDNGLVLSPTKMKIAVSTIDFLGVSTSAGTRFARLSFDISSCLSSHGFDLLELEALYESQYHHVKDRPPSIPLSFGLATVLPRWSVSRINWAPDPRRRRANSHRLRHGLFGPPNPATDEKALWYRVKGSVTFLVIVIIVGNGKLPVLRFSRLLFFKGSIDVPAFGFEEFYKCIHGLFLFLLDVMDFDQVILRISCCIVRLDVGWHSGSLRNLEVANPGSERIGFHAYLRLSSMSTTWVTREALPYYPVDNKVVDVRSTSLTTSCYAEWYVPVSGLWSLRIRHVVRRGSYPRTALSGCGSRLEIFLMNLLRHDGQDLVVVLFTVFVKLVVRQEFRGPLVGALLPLTAVFLTMELAGIWECLGNSLYRLSSMSTTWVTREALPYYPVDNKVVDVRATFTLINECSFTVWPGISGTLGFNNIGFKLMHNSSCSFQVTDSWEVLWKKVWPICYGGFGLKELNDVGYYIHEYDEVQEVPEEGYELKQSQEQH